MPFVSLTAFYRMHEVLESDSDARVFANVAAMPVSMSASNDLSPINKHNEVQKIRKNFVETWLWNTTIAGYGMPSTALMPE